MHELTFGCDFRSHGEDCKAQEGSDESVHIPILAASTDRSENPRSRTYRRATSPSMNTDKALKETPRASDATPTLKPYSGGGIQKKVKKKVLTHAQKLRQAKGIERGEATQEQFDAKVREAKQREKKRSGRRAMWEDVNSVTKEEARKAIKAPGRFEVGEDDEDLMDSIQPFHGDTEIKVIGGVQVPSFATGEALNVAVGPIFAANAKKPGSFGVSKPNQPAPPPFLALEEPTEAETHTASRDQVNEPEPEDEIT